MSLQLSWDFLSLFFSLKTEEKANGKQGRFFDKFLECLYCQPPTSLFSSSWIENYQFQLVRVFEPSIQSFKKKRMASRDSFLDKFLNGFGLLLSECFHSKIIRNYTELS